jgi:hypothetical protein
MISSDLKSVRLRKHKQNSIDGIDIDVSLFSAFFSRHDVMMMIERKPQLLVFCNEQLCEIY